LDLVAIENKFLIAKNEFVDNDKWTNLIHSTKFKTPFQTKQFFEVCNKAQGHEGLVLAVEGKDESYHALCVTDIICERGLKSIFSKRAIIYGGPLISPEGGNDALQALLESLVKELHKKVIYIEIRNYNNYEDYKTLYNHLQWDYIPWLNARKHLDFSDLNELIKSFKYNRRREIRLSLNAGLSYYETFNLKDIKGFYEILKTTYRKKIGLPLPSLQFFNEFVDSGLMKVFVVKDKNDIIGGSFCIFHNEDSLFTFYYCGIRNYKHNTFPTHLAVLAAMEFGIKNRLKYLDFMGVGEPGKEYGVRNYKMGFNPELTEDGRFLKIENKLLYSIGYQAIKVLKWIRLNSLFLS
jgi:lipid II:glycine glycyltransferase (peptidoglycan interpeptide bridge formation enzyme)